MTPSGDLDITGLLNRIRADDPRAVDELLSQVYADLRRMAAQLMRDEPPGHTLQPTALLHEAVQRLLGGNALKTAPDRHNLFAAVYQAMRRVLVDHARRRLALRRGGAYEQVPIDEVLDELASHWNLTELDLIAIHEALGRLEERSARQRMVVDLKVLGRMTNSQVAEELGMSEGTVERDFRLARAFLSRELAGIAPS